MPIEDAKQFRLSKSDKSMMCHKCNKKEAVFDSPGIWCAVCWADWWFIEDTDHYDEDQIEELKKDRIEFLRSEDCFAEN